jgi:hypothetical protein
MNFREENGLYLECWILVLIVMAKACLSRSYGLVSLRAFKPQGTQRLKHKVHEEFSLCS